MLSVSELTGGKARMGPGTLDGSIKTLLEGRLIQEVEEREKCPSLSARRRGLVWSSAGLLPRMKLMSRLRLRLTPSLL
jgi:hypothetical protein